MTRNLDEWSFGKNDQRRAGGGKRDLASLRLVTLRDAGVRDREFHLVLMPKVRLPTRTRSARAAPAAPASEGMGRRRNRETHGHPSNPENCERLAITVATAKTDVARILQKVGLRGRVQVSIYAYESGLLSSGEPELRPQARRRRRTR